MQSYRDRKQAAEMLADSLAQESFNHPLILGLPRGGVPLAAIVARRLNLPWDILVVRKIGAPGFREYGIGAMAEDEEPMLIRQAGYDRAQIQEIIDQERGELRRRISSYRQGRELMSVQDRDIILVDDGLATGVTTTAAAKFLKRQGAARVILAVPVGPASGNQLVESVMDKIICPFRPHNFGGVGAWYDDFSEVSDQEVLNLLKHRQSSEGEKRDV
jgi:putative phosphoribosyl transferase